MARRSEPVRLGVLPTKADFNEWYRDVFVALALRELRAWCSYSGDGNGGYVAFVEGGSKSNRTYVCGLFDGWRAARYQVQA
jgi:hypothetical protein